jgi:hypothetical protein
MLPWLCDASMVRPPDSDHDTRSPSSTAPDLLLEAVVERMFHLTTIAPPGSSPVTLPLRLLSMEGIHYASGNDIDATEHRAWCKAVRSRTAAQVFRLSNDVLRASLPPHDDAPVVVRTRANACSRARTVMTCNVMLCASYRDA